MNFQKEYLLEEEILGLTREKFYQKVERAPLATTHPGRIIFSQIIPGFLQYTTAYLAGKSPQFGGQLRAVLRELALADVCTIVVKTILSNLMKPISLVNLAITIGAKIEDGLEYQRFQRQEPHFLKKVAQQLKKVPAHHRPKVFKAHLERLGLESCDFPVEFQAKMGHIFLKIFQEATQLLTFTEKKTKGQQKPLKLVAPTEELQAWITSQKEACQYLTPHYLPMVSEPLPWSSNQGGGYYHPLLQKQTPLVKDKFTKQLPPMEQEYRVINALQRVPWRINQELFHLITELWEKGGVTGALPRAERLELPPPPWRSAADLRRMKEATPEQVTAWKRAAAQIYAKNLRNTSKQIALAQKLAIAAKFLKEEAIYFPWKLDWRGRKYPLPVGLQPAQETFWQQANKPFTFLRAAMDYRGYLREGAAFCSHLPLMVDGKCNGLQHYAALLRDPGVGELVCLMPGDTPRDIYQAVADLVRAKLAPLTNWEAQWWLPNLTRKVCKRGTMTYVYGAKAYGVADQLLEDWEEMGLPEVDNKLQFQLCKFLGKYLHSSIAAVAPAAAQGMRWLQQLVKLYNQANLPFSWVTPSGFRPQMHYKKKIRKRGGKNGVMLYTYANELNPKKQIDGVAPNYIHSLDAAHLSLTVNKCLANGLVDFSFIHDSYGTHACHLSCLHQYLREAFIDLYQGSHIDNLVSQAERDLQEYPKLLQKMPPPPQLGSLELKEVQNSLYFFR